MSNSQLSYSGPYYFMERAYWLVATETRQVAYVFSEADARLMVAASEGIDALEYLISECTVQTESENDAFLNAQAVIDRVQNEAT